MAIDVVLDTETTGLGHFAGRPDGVVQVGVAYRSPASQIVLTWSELCNPGAAFFAAGRASEAFAINGRTVAEVRKARPAKEVATQLRRRLRTLESKHDGVVLHAYNVDFDRPFLEASPWDLDWEWGPCIMKSAHRALNPSGKWPKLIEACARFDLAPPASGFHDAGNDAHMALLVHEKVGKARVARRL